MSRECPTTVGKLIEYLKEFPEDLPVIYQCWSDWEPLHLEDIELVKGVTKDFWVMRVYDKHVPKMSTENRSNISEFLAFPGN